MTEVFPSVIFTPFCSLNAVAKMVQQTGRLLPGGKKLKVSFDFNKFYLPSILIFKLLN